MSGFFYYSSESIPFARKRVVGKLPPALAEAVKLERRVNLSRSELFLRQGKLLANYEDDFEYNGQPDAFYHAYSALTDKDLRGYFSWRTKFRKGLDAEASEIFLYIYINELVNNIGAASPLEGLEKLARARDSFKDSFRGVARVIDEIKLDYIAYYDLDPGLAKDSQFLTWELAAETLANIARESEESVISAIKTLCPKWIGRSRFYAEYSADMDKLIYRVVKRVAETRDKRYKKSFVKYYLTETKLHFHYMFPGLIFANPLKRKNFVYNINKNLSYKFQSGTWYRISRELNSTILARLEQLIKTIDSVARQASSYRYTIQSPVAVKWILKIIAEEIENLKKEKVIEEKREKAKIDISRLAKIRMDASETRDKLIVEEEKYEETPEPVAAKKERSDTDLSPEENRFLHSILRGESLDWLREEGLLLSVLVDGINEKLFDKFNDSVMDDSPAIFEDYIDAIKEIIAE